MDAEWGGLETLLAAAKFVESQEQEKNQKLIEICEEYPSSEKSSYSTESASSLTPVQSTVASPSPPTISSVAPKNVAPLTTASYTNTDVSYVAPNNGNASGNNFTLSTIATLPTLTNGSSPAVTISTLPSFSPSPSLTFTFTTPSNAANSQTPSLLKIPPTNSRLPSASLPRHHASPMVIQRTSSPPPPLLPPARTIQHHSQQPQQQQQPQPPPLHQQQQQQQQQQLQSSMSTIAIIPHRTYTERTANVTDIKRKLSASGTREVHNKLEKNRRAHLKECFELLKSQVPAIQDEKKPSNLTILRTAIRYVQILRRREQELESELERLAREKIINQQRLTTLKKELSAQWDHIDFNSLLPESVESKPNTAVENGADHRDYEMERDADKIAVMSDADDSSQVKSRGDTYYGSSSSTGSCSISPLHISSPNVVSTTSDSLPPQIHIVESASVPFEKLSNTTVVSPLQFLSTSTLRMITDSEQPIALVQHNGGEKLTESATLPKMAVHAGNAFTIFSDSFQKVAAPNPGSGNTTISSVVRNNKVSNSSVQFATGLTLPSVSVNHKNVTLPVKTTFPQVTTNGTVVTTSSVGERSSAVLTTVPVHSNVSNLVNHSFVVTQPSSGQMLLTTTSPHIPTNVMPTPLLKTVSRLQPINGHQLVVKPTMVVVSTAAAASK